MHRYGKDIKKRQSEQPMPFLFHFVFILLTERYDRTENLAIQATQSWNSTKRMVSFLLSVSRRIVAIVAVHGTYSRQNTISARALAVPNPILFKATSAVLMPCAVAMFEIPKRTPQLRLLLPWQRFLRSVQR